MAILIGFAFLAGLVTILAPCIWPILPIVLSSSVSGEGHQRPLGITVGIMISFAFFTLTLSYLVRIFNFDPNVLRIVAVIIIGLLGVTMIIPSLSRILEGFISRLSGVFGQKVRQGNGFGVGFITGLSLGIVWSPCAGPILAAVAALAATGKVTFSVVLVTIAYVIGAGIPLFIFAYGGQRIIKKTRFLSLHIGRIQQAFGVIMLITAVAIYTNYDRVVETKLLNVFPEFTAGLNSFENNNALKEQLNILKGKDKPDAVRVTDKKSYFNENLPAPAIVGINKWLNTDKPLTIKSLRGKVVLIDFWTYTCINCIRTIPYVEGWYKMYKDKGFVVIGVHTPEFQFEHNTKNVEDAIKMFGITYPVAQDNDYATWNNYNNEYWPAEYLIDAKGRIRRTHFGEGEYNEMEMAIRELLKENGQAINQSVSNLPNLTPEGRQSPETYLGTYRMEYYYPSGNLRTGYQQFEFPGEINLNTFSLSGSWDIREHEAVAEHNARLEYRFYADKVFLVLQPGSAGKMAKIKVLLDGKTISKTDAGSDVRNGIVTVDANRLYNLVNLRGEKGDHLLQLQFEEPGIKAYAFTFG